MRAAAIVGALLAALALAGCSTAVEVPSYPASASPAQRTDAEVAFLAAIPHDIAYDDTLLTDGRTICAKLAGLTGLDRLNVVTDAARNGINGNLYTKQDAAAVAVLAAKYLCPS